MALCHCQHHIIVTIPVSGTMYMYVEGWPCGKLNIEVVTINHHKTEYIFIPLCHNRYRYYDADKNCDAILFIVVAIVRIPNSCHNTPCPIPIQIWKFQFVFQNRVMWWRSCISWHPGQQLAAMASMLHDWPIFLNRYSPLLRRSHMSWKIK